MNPHAGEVGLVVDGVTRRCRLTLGALAEMEDGLGGESLARLAPDLVVTLSGGDPLRDRAFWKTHAPGARVLSPTNAALFERPGPRLIDAIAGLATP